MGAADECSLGTALRRLRVVRGLSLVDAARRGGVSKAALSAWENGNRRPRGPALVRLLDALGADPRTKARLTGEPVHAGTAPDEGETYDRLWAAVLREHRGWKASSPSGSS